MGLEVRGKVGVRGRVGVGVRVGARVRVGEQRRTWYAPASLVARVGIVAARSSGLSASVASAESSQQSPSAPCLTSVGAPAPSMSRGGP